VLVPSDENLDARVNPAGNGSIYELNAQDGTVLRRFKLEDGRSGSGVAGVHDGKFLSFEHGQGKLVPLMGTAEPAAEAASADQPKPTSCKADRQ
jgi:outer membrane protein assembly factor BamB